LNNCTVESRDDKEAIAAALQRSTTIKCVELGKLSTPLVVAILEKLRHKRSLKKLACAAPQFERGTALEEQSRAIESILIASTTIEEFTLVFGGIFCTADEFQPICQGLIQSRSVTTLRLYCCDVCGQEFTPLFQALFQTKENLYSLHVEKCNFARGHFCQSLNRALVRSGSPLKSLALGISRCHSDQNFEFSKLVRAVEQSNLDSFSLLNGLYGQSFRFLIDSMPRLKVRELSLQMYNTGNDENNMKNQQLLGAAKRIPLINNVDQQRSLFTPIETKKLLNGR